MRYKHKQLQMKQITSRKKRLFKNIVKRTETSDKTAFMDGMFSIFDITGSKYVNQEPLIIFKKRPSRVKKILASN